MNSTTTNHPKQRPTSITVIGWLLTIGNGLGIVCYPLVFAMPEVQQAAVDAGQPISGIAMLVTFLAGVLGVISGIALLKGLNWGRFLYFIYVPILIVISIVLNGFHSSVFITLIAYLAFFWFLTRPDATMYFRGSSPAETE